MFGLEEREVQARRTYVNHVRSEIEVRSTPSCPLGHWFLSRRDELIALSLPLPCESRTCGSSCYHETSVCLIFSTDILWRLDPRRCLGPSADVEEHNRGIFRSGRLA